MTVTDDVVSARSGALRAVCECSILRGERRRCSHRANTGRRNRCRSRVRSLKIDGFSGIRVVNSVLERSFAFEVMYRIYTGANSISSRK